MKRKIKLSFIFILLAGLILPAGCGILTPPPGDATFPAKTLAQSTEAPYPASPEEVVLFFLEAYPLNPADGIRYLSPRLTASLTEDSAQDLLPLREIPNGYNVQQGSTSLEMQTSVILVELVYDSAAYWVEFKLALVDGKWKIDQLATT